jgi:hypothetical protein
MPVIGCGDDHRVHILVGQQAAVIHVRFDVRVPAALDAFLAMRTVHVAHGDYFDARHRHHGVDQVAAPSTEANAADADGFVRGLGREQRRREGRSGCQRGGGFACVLEELPTR